MPRKRHQTALTQLSKIHDFYNKQKYSDFTWRCALAKHTQDHPSSGPYTKESLKKQLSQTHREDGRIPSYMEAYFSYIIDVAEERISRSLKENSLEWYAELRRRTLRLLSAAQNSTLAGPAQMSFISHVIERSLQADTLTSEVHHEHQKKVEILINMWEVDVAISTGFGTERDC